MDFDSLLESKRWVGFPTRVLLGMSTVALIAALLLPRYPLASGILFSTLGLLTVSVANLNRVEKYADLAVLLPVGTCIIWLEAPLKLPALFCLLGILAVTFCSFSRRFPFTTNIFLSLLAMFPLVALLSGADMSFMAMPLQSEDRARGASLLLLFLVSAALTSLLAFRAIPRDTAQQARTGSNSALLLCSILFGTVLTLDRLAYITLTPSWVLLLISLMTAIPMGLLALYGSRGYAQTATLMAVIMLLVGFLSGSLQSTALPVTALVVGILLRWQSGLVAFSAAVASFVLFANTIKVEIRSLSGGSQKLHLLEGTEKLTVVWSAFQRSIQGLATNIDRNATRLTTAMDWLGVVSREDAQTPPVVIFRTTAQLLIPSSIRPDTIMANDANVLGRFFGILAPMDFTTSANVPLVVESFLTGGPLLLLFCGCLVGLALSMVDRMLRGGSWSMQAAGLTLLVVGMRSLDTDTSVFLPWLVFGTPAAFVIFWGFQEWLDRDRVVQCESTT